MEFRTLGREVARFAAVGIASAALDYAVLQGFIAIGVDRYFARLASTIPVVTATWLANRRFTFSAQAAATWSEYFRYFGISGAGLAINYGLYWLGLFIGLQVWLAFIIGTGVGAVFNFVRYRILLK